MTHIAGSGRSLRRVVVTGGAGFLGSHLCTRLVSEDVEVVCLDNLLTGDLRRVKRCPSHDCLWLFHDDSKNLSRRWCAMDDCGTLDKVRRYRERGN